MIPRRNRDGWEHYRCSRRHTYGDCDAPAVSRRKADEAVLASFLRLDVDLDETRLALVQGAAAKEQQAEAALARIRSDYLAAAITAEEWHELRAELEEGREASRRRAAQLRQRAHAVEEDAARLDHETELLARLAGIKESVARRLADA